MLRKRCTIEVVIDLPVAGPLSDVKRFVKTSENRSVDVVSYKILKSEQLEEELLPHEQATGQRRAIKAILEEAVKKAGLSKYVYTYVWKWGGGGFRFIMRKYKCDKCIPLKDVDGNPTGYTPSAAKCKSCKNLIAKLNYARSYKFNGSAILLESYDSYSVRKEVVVGSIADQNMTEFINHLKSILV